MGGGLNRDIPEESGMKDLKWEWDVITCQRVKGVVILTQAWILEVSHNIVLEWSG